MIVLHAAMACDRSIGTREAGSGNFCIFYVRMRESDPRGACTAMALSCKFEKSGFAGQIHGIEPRVSRKQLAGRDGLTRVTRISRVIDPTRPARF